MSKIISAILSVFLLLSSGNTPVNKAENWYIKKGDQGSTPTFPPSIEYIRSQNGFCIDEDAAKSGLKVIYLTFDAGYENGNIARILDVLREKEVCAAFFILSNLIHKNPELVKQMVADGHTVCNHTKNHKDMTTLSNEDMEINLKALDDQFESLTGVKMAKYFRFPEGRYSEEKVALCNSLGYRCVFWSAAYADWDNNKQSDSETALKKLISQTHPGAVYLLHPTSKTNADILAQLIDTWRNMGYEFGSIEDIS